jgi:type IV pilus assembly protein PilB
MGVEPFLVASSLVLTAAQRLCRRICPYCKEETEIPMSVLERVGVAKADLTKLGGKKFLRGKGCAKCNNTGYYGRMGTLEVFLIDDAIRDMIIKCAPANQLKEYAVKHGMATLRDNALKKFINGDTTLEEVLRITTEE